MEGRGGGRMAEGQTGRRGRSRWLTNWIFQDDNLTIVYLKYVDKYIFKIQSLILIRIELKN